MPSSLEFTQFTLAVEKLIWHKASGINGISPKALEDDNR